MSGGRASRSPPSTSHRGRRPRRASPPPSASGSRARRLAAASASAAPWRRRRRRRPRLPSTCCSSPSPVGLAVAAAGARSARRLPLRPPRLCRGASYPALVARRRHGARAAVALAFLAAGCASPPPPPWPSSPPAADVRRRCRPGLPRRSCGSPSRRPRPGHIAAVALPRGAAVAARGRRLLLLLGAAVGTRPSVPPLPPPLFARHRLRRRSPSPLARLAAGFRGDVPRRRRRRRPPPSSRHRRRRRSRRRRPGIPTTRRSSRRSRRRRRSQRAPPSAPPSTPPSTSPSPPPDSDDEECASTPSFRRTDAAVDGNRRRSTRRAAALGLAVAAPGDDDVETPRAAVPAAVARGRRRRLAPPRRPRRRRRRSASPSAARHRRRRQHRLAAGSVATPTTSKSMCSTSSPSPRRTSISRAPARPSLFLARHDGVCAADVNARCHESNVLDVVLRSRWSVRADVRPAGPREGDSKRPEDRGTTWCRRPTRTSASTVRDVLFSGNRAKARRAKNHSRAARRRCRMCAARLSHAEKPIVVAGNARSICFRTLCRTRRLQDVHILSMSRTYLRPTRAYLTWRAHPPRAWGDAGLREVSTASRSMCR